MSYHNKIKDVDLEVFNHGVAEYHQGWEAADQYAYNVLTGVIKAGQHAKNSCARYIYDRTKRDDLDFRIDDVDDVIDFANMLKHVKGKMVGKPMLLMQWMIFVLANIYGWYYTKGERIGERRFVKAFTLVARGNAKSTLCSIVSLWTLLTSPNGSPSAYSVARNAKQARIVFEDAKKMIRGASFQLKKYFRTSAHKIEQLLYDGLFEPMASDSQSLDGLRVALGICDELHAHRDSELMNTLINGTSATVDPLIFSISTAGIQLDGICVQERNLIRFINEDIEDGDSYFGIEYSIDEQDQWDDPEVWIKANPSLGHAVRLTSLKEELGRAKQSAVNRKDFMTKYCNIFVNMNDNPYIDIFTLQSTCAKELNIDKYVGKECFGGLDLAQKFDLAALSMIFPEDDGGLTAFQRHYFPEGALEKLTSHKYEMYLQWEEDGHLILTPGNSTNFDFIMDDIRWYAKNFDLQMVGYDPYAGAQLALTLQEEKIDMVEVQQSFAKMSEPAKLLQSLVADQKFNYQHTDRCFEWCAANAVITTDMNENIKVHKDKTKPHDKVDSVIALITGMALATLKEPKKKTPYKKRGLITF